MLKRLAVGAIALMLGVPVAEAAPAGQVTVAMGSDISTLDPTMDISIIGLKVSGNVFSALTRIGSDGAVTPDLALSWSSTDGAKVWTFQMDPKARFQDGTPVTSEDVVWTINKERTDSTSPVRSYVATVASVEAVDAHTVRFTLLAPFSAFDRQASLLNIPSKAAYEKMGADQFSKTPIGSGPFKVLRWIKDDRIVLEADPDYWKGAAKIKSLIFRPIASEAARFAALQSGDVDLAVGLPPAILEGLKGRPGVKVETTASNQIVYIGINVGNPALSTVKMRQAIAAAIDREAIGKSLLRGTGKPAGQILAPVTFGFDPSIKPEAQNVARARELVKESGYQGEVIALQYPNNSINLGNEVAQAIAGYLKNAGINVALQGMEYPAFSQLWLQRKLTGLYLHSFGPSIMDAELPLTMLYQSKTTRGYWSDTEVDGLIAAQRAETDQVKRKDIIDRIWRIAGTDMPYAPLYNVQDSYGMSDRLTWQPRADGRLFFVDASISK